MNAREIESALALDPSWRGTLHDQWLRLLDLLVWGDLKGTSPGTVGKARKRALEVGEKLRSVFNDRNWIPQPREQLKNALGSCLSLRDSLLLLERAAKEIEGGADRAEFETILIKLHQEVVGPLRAKENRWAELLDQLNRDQLGRDE